MCDVCKIQGLDYKFLNGDKDVLHNNYLYKVLVGKTAKIRLCHIHDIELFHLGEKRFVLQHLELLRVLKNQP